MSIVAKDVGLYFYDCGQVAGWMRMPLGTNVDLGQGDIVLDADPAPPRIGAQ